MFNFMNQSYNNIDPSKNTTTNMPNRAQLTNQQAMNNAEAVKLKRMLTNSVEKISNLAPYHHNNTTSSPSTHLPQTTTTATTEHKRSTLYALSTPPTKRTFRVHPSKMIPKIQQRLSHNRARTASVNNNQLSNGLIRETNTQQPQQFFKQVMNTRPRINSVSARNIISRRSSVATQHKSSTLSSLSTPQINSRPSVGMSTNLSQHTPTPSSSTTSTEHKRSTLSTPTPNYTSSTIPNPLTTTNLYDAINVFFNQIRQELHEMKTEQTKQKEHHPLPNEIEYQQKLNNLELKIIVLEDKLKNVSNINPNTDVTQMKSEYRLLQSTISSLHLQLNKILNDNANMSNLYNQLKLEYDTNFSTISHDINQLKLNQETKLNAMEVTQSKMNEDISLLKK